MERCLPTALVDNFVRMVQSHGTLETAQNLRTLEALRKRHPNVGSLLAPIVGARILVVFGEDAWPPVFFSACAFYAVAGFAYAGGISTKEEKVEDDEARDGDRDIQEAREGKKEQ